MKFAGLAVLLLLSACATDKTPLTPQGQLNACLRDEINARLADGSAAELGEAALAQKTARYCLKKMKMRDSFMQDMAFRNARALLTSKEGTSLR